MNEIDMTLGKTENDNGDEMEDDEQIDISKYSKYDVMADEYDQYFGESQSY